MGIIQIHLIVVLGCREVDGDESQPSPTALTHTTVLGTCDLLNQLDRELIFCVMLIKIALLVGKLLDLD